MAPRRHVSKPDEAIPVPKRRLLRGATAPLAMTLERPRQHQAEDRDDHTQVQKQIASCHQIVEAKDERQNVIDDYQKNAE